MKASGLFRIGRDTELRYTQAGTAVASVSLACDYGRRDESGRRPSQWVDAVIFGKRAEALAQYLTKGSQHVFYLSDMHIESFSKKDGTPGVKLSCVIDDVELTARRDAQLQASPKPAQLPQPTNNPPSIATWDDDVPF